MVLLERLTGAPPALHGKQNDFCQCINPVPTQRPGSPQQPVAVASQAKWRGDQDWHRERVLRVHGNSTYGIIYDDGELRLKCNISRQRDKL